LRRRQFLFDMHLPGHNAGLFFGDATVVDDYKIEMNFRCVALGSLQMLARGVVVGFTGLCHQVADKDLRGLAFTDGGGDSRYE